MLTPSQLLPNKTVTQISVKSCRTFSKHYFPVALTYSIGAENMKIEKGCK